VLNIVIGIIAIVLLVAVIYRIRQGKNEGINHDEAARIARDRIDDPEFKSELDRNGLRLNRQDEKCTQAGKEGSRELSEMFRSG
jgi:FtsZ-interacting cell division protein ZipA